MKPIWLLLVSVPLVASSYRTAVAAGTHIDAQHVTLGVDPAALSKRDVRWRVYTLATPRVSPATFGTAVGQFLGTGPLKGKVSVLEDRLQYRGPKDASLYCTQDRTSGRLSLKRSLEDYFGDKVPDLPDPEAAKRLAVEFLSKSKLAPRNDAELRMIHSGGLRRTSVADGRGGPVGDKLRAIVFGRTLDGVAVQGSGSKIVVHVGNRGEIVGVDRRGGGGAPPREGWSAG